MDTYTVALFGEAEKGDYRNPFLCKTVAQLLDLCGNPPLYSRGIDLAIQALLFERELLFFRVKEEGFSYEDYFFGLHFLEKKTGIPKIDAICLPGVGDEEIIGAMTTICQLYHSLLITTSLDFYDYLTDQPGKKWEKSN